MFQLSDNDIHLSAQATDKQQAIELVADALVKAGYVESGYLQGMLERESQMTTYLSNGIAIPHGSLNTRHMVNKTGVQIFQFPQGINWGDGHIAYIVIGLAADSDSHLTLLRQITRLLDNEKAVKQLATTQNVKQFRSLIMGDTHYSIINAESISLGVETKSLLTLTALNAEKLQQQQAVNNDFIMELLASPALPLGKGIWLTDAVVGNQRNAIALSRAKQAFTHNSKLVQAVLTIATIDDHIHHTLTCLLDEQVQDILLTGSTEDILITLYTQPNTESAVENSPTLIGQIPTIETIVTIQNTHGLHYRPAAILVNHIKKYNVSIAVQNLDNDSQLISAKSLIKVISLGAQKGHRLRFIATGQEAKQALEEIRKLIESGLGES
ncbi:multiphosphoryl transfer protein [Pasteurella canis]|uniref:fused PTS fructose transporter subunit IIA/HPr protein n=1 Tax=Pasteurella canis TaxID=753 RepID=UPI001D109D3B|nr:fused PTS fructose transporter subunit IIA/HPr protein [Pasteurella canis]UDW83233.1 fused PTS fructose transporter subunit IIA/HPr protein [Pasteurella canis]GJJ80815.1 multiphosphoryl transfer protein [Pasteurella canis]